MVFVSSVSIVLCAVSVSETQEPPPELRAAAHACAEGTLPSPENRPFSMYPSVSLINERNRRMLHWRRGKRKPTEDTGVVSCHDDFSSLHRALLGEVLDVVDTTPWFLLRSKFHHCRRQEASPPPDSVRTGDIRNRPRTRRTKEPRRSSLLRYRPNLGYPL